VSSERALQLGRSLELMRRLREVVADFARREEQISKESRTRRQAVSRRIRDSLQAEESAASAEYEAAKAHYEHEEERVRGIYVRRRARIRQTYTAGIRNLPRQAQEAKRKWMGDLQMRHFRAERMLTSGMKAADAAFADHAAETQCARGLTRDRRATCEEGIWRLPSAGETAAHCCG
jgi:hypothetical protein